MTKADILGFLPGLLGGVAIFLFGMNMLSDGLQKAAGEKLRHIISVLTNNPLAGILVGTVVTAVIQSSSATTVMVIGFVSAGFNDPETGDRSNYRREYRYYYNSMAGIN